MDEYQFQYELDPLLKDQAAEAVKKTEWLQYLDYVKSIMALKGLWAVNYLFQSTMVMFDIYRPAAKMLPGQLTNYTANDLFTTLLLIVFAVSFFILLFKWARKASMIHARKYQIKKPVYRYIVSVCLTVAPLFFFGFGNVRQRLNFSAFVFVISLLIWDSVDLRKLKRNLRSWGLIDQSHDIFPATPQLSAAGPVIDDTVVPPIGRKSSVIEGGSKL